MIAGTGVDLCEVDRMREAIERHGERFLKRVFTDREIAYVERKANRFERYAARFAAKEAGMKALGTGWRGGITWHDFEVANLATGQPTLRFAGRAADLAALKRISSVSLSLTHTPQFGMAMVILET